MTYTTWPTTLPPRGWQNAFLKAILTHYDQPRVKNALAAVCPGAGKTIGAYLLVHNLLRRGDIQHVIIVVHTDRIREQWITTARQVNLQATTDIPADNRRWPDDIQVLVMTYQQVVNRADNVARLATRAVQTLVIFDEIHHAGDENTWGDSIKAAFHRAHRRLLLTGTAFRNDGQSIPYVTYNPRTWRVEAQFSLDYAEALREGYVAPVYFHTYDVEGKWSKGDDEFTASFGDRLSQEHSRYLLNTAISSDRFLRKMIIDAHARLMVLRKSSHPDAAGLIIARDQNHARQIVRLIKLETKDEPVLVISDDSDAGSKLDTFRDGRACWLIAVRMVTEGVDIPRLRVAVFATNVLSDLFFWQWVGRVNRVVPGLDDQAGYLYIPANQDLLEYARGIYEQRLQVLPPKRKAAARPVVTRAEPTPEFEAISATAIEGAVIGAGQAYSPQLVHWAAGQIMAKGFYTVSPVDYIRISCDLLGVGIDGLMAHLGLDGEQ